MSTDTEFALDCELEACVVTRELLRQIEMQLAALERDVLGDIAHVSSRKYELSVFDAFGVETFGAASDIPMSGLPETTDCVRLVLEAKADPEGSPGERSIKVKLAFRSEHGNRLLI